MLALMLDPHFMDLSLVCEYVGQVPTIVIVAAYDNRFLLPMLKTLYQKLHGCPNSIFNIVQEDMHNTKPNFGIGVSKE
jgi:hypothetical protein